MGLEFGGGSFGGEGEKMEYDWFLTADFALHLKTLHSCTVVAH